MPAAPAVAPFTARWWADLPEMYRAADEADTGVGWPLLRFMSLLGDQAGEIAALRDRFALHPDPNNPAGPWISDLSNPATADAAWLPWMAQLAGVGGLEAGPGTAETFAQLIIDYPTFADLAAGNASFAMVRHHAAEVTTGGGSSPEGLRATLLDTTGARFAGSTGAWERLIAPLLTGDRRVLHRRIFGGDPWHLQLETYVIETPDPAVVGALIDLAAKAAGLTVTYATRTGSSFADVVDGFATFADVIAGLPTFADLTSWVP